MDESSRRLERTSKASGDSFARVRAANEHLRGGRWEAALAALEDGDGEAETATRALAQARLGRGGEALRTVEGALVRGVMLEAAVLAEALEPALAGKVKLGRARAARVLARVGGALADPLRTDPDPLVRIAFVTERPVFDRTIDRTSRVYGSHGGDYTTGRFIAFDTTLEMRLRTFELKLFHAIETALSTLADDAHAVETLELHAAFGDGWGLGGNDHPVDVGVLLRAIDAFNELDLVPWKLRECDVRPYDLMEDEERLVRRLARDIGGHPVGHQVPFDPKAPLLARLMALHPFRGPPCPWKELEPHLEEARRIYTPLGARACELSARISREKQSL